MAKPVKTPLIGPQRQPSLVSLIRPQALSAKSADRTLIVFATVIEAITGLILISVPSLFGRVVLGVELPDVARGMTRLYGIALLAFTVASWPERDIAKNAAPATRGLLVYNLFVAIYFCYWGLTHSAGLLLWPAVALHATLTVLLVRVELSEGMR
jgi:hypothetical protein